MRIGELSERTGVSVRMLRYYEEQGLLLPRREPNGYRHYAEEDVEVAGALRCFTDLGFDLATAAEVARVGCTETGVSSPADRDEARRLVDDHLERVAQLREELDRVTGLLQGFREQLDAEVPVAT